MATLTWTAAGALSAGGGIAVLVLGRLRGESRVGNTTETKGDER